MTNPDAEMPTADDASVDPVESETAVPESEEAADLRERIARLEAENAELTTTKPERPSRTRSVLSATLIVIGLVLAPVALVSSWARAELVDTDRFVQTLAPLAAESAVQDFIADSATTAIDESLNLTGVVNDLFDGIAGLDLPPTAQVAITQLRGSAVSGIESLISTGVQRVVGSDQFVQVWETLLREAHARSIAVIQGEEGTSITLADDGTVSLDVGVVIAAVKTALVDNGVTIAQSIPAISRRVTLLQNDSLANVRVGYQFAVALGTWLPWVSFGAMVLGVALARRRIAVASRTGAWLAVSLGVLAAALAVGRLFFLGAVSPSVMPSHTAEVIFDQLVSLLVPTLTALIVFGVLVAVGAWIAGPSPAARAVRRAGNAAFDGIRSFLDRYGLGTGRFGRTVDRIRPALIVVIVSIAVLTIFLVRPVTTASVWWAVFGMLVALLLVELLRRPERPYVDEEPEELDEPESAVEPEPESDPSGELKKVTVRLSERDLAFLDSGPLNARYGSRTAAVQDAVRLLRERKLEDWVD